MRQSLIAFLSLMMAPRLMTLAFIGRAGGGGAGDPPAAWLMPLIGDAVIGFTALLATYAVLKLRGLAIWAALLIWNALGAWDALAAFVVAQSNPWPDFFMLQIFGNSMFFGTATLHVILIYLLCRDPARRHFPTA